MVQVVVAERAVGIRTALTAEDLAVRDVPVASAPEGATRSIDDVVGKLTLVELYPGEPLLSQRLVEPNLTAADGRTSLVMVEDQVLMAVPAQDLMGKIGVLKRGDHVDIHFSLPFPANRGPGNAGDDEDEQATFGLLQNLVVADFVGGEPVATGATENLSGEGGEQATSINPQAILLTVNAQDALVLKYLIDAGGTLDLVLRAPGMERPFDTDPVDVDYLIDRYDIPTQVGR
jgi:pilus assembly protein CpaB